MVKKELQDWLKVFNEVTVPGLVANGFKPTPTNAREGLANLTKGLTTAQVDIAQTYDDYVLADEYNVPVRIYIPNKNEQLPVMVFFHGGGHMAGSVTVYDPICRRLANKTNHIVISVEYRLTPENPYPAGVVDSINAVKGIYKTLENREVNFKKELVIVGDSGGAANCALVADAIQYDETIEISKQVLIYPSLDYTMDSQSMEDNGVGYLLGKGKIAWYFDNYFFNDEDRKDASPLHKPMTNKLPETIVFTAQYDPLRDEGLEYVEKLRSVGVKVEHHNLENMIHTYICMEDLCKEECEFTYSTISNFLNK